MEHMAAGDVSKLFGQIDDSEDDIKRKEDSIMELGSQLAANKQTHELRTMIENTHPFLLTLGKAKAAKLVRDLLDLCLMIEGQDGDIKVELCKECILWAEQQNRIFLRQTLQARLIRLYNDLHRYNLALLLANELVRELKKVDDKDLLIEVELEESKAFYHLGNLGRARTSLTGARTTANAVYVRPQMQAALDVQAGIVHAAEKRDFKTAYSYFYEAFEAYDSTKQEKLALQALKYMLLCKVMLDLPEEAISLIQGKVARNYTNSEAVQAMKAIAVASKERSLKDFNATFGRYGVELQMDPVIKKHFYELSERMLEKELSRLVEPYTCVQISYIARAIDLDRSIVERKLAQMILDHKFHGSLHQLEGVVIAHEAEKQDVTYKTSVEAIHAFGDVLDALYARANTLN